MKKFLLALAFVPLLISAQNLVPNPGFETQTSCPLVSEITKAPPWNTANGGTPDLFNNSCPSQNGPGRSGIGSSGVYVFSTFNNYREYIEAPLSAALVSGQRYCVEFYVKRANFKYASDRIGAYFSVDSVYGNQTAPLSATPQVQNAAGNYIVSTTSWTKISGSFIADGGERFIIIGNFYNDAQTTKDSVATGSDVCYYKIDDISVTTCVTGVNDLAESSFKVYPNPANDLLFVETENPSEVLRVFNVSGQLLIEQNDAGSLRSISTANLVNGIYLLEIHTAEGIGFKRFVVNR